jgi:predicted nucleic acid-binding protein
VTLISDTGPVVAALNAGDPDHTRCRELLSGADDIVIPGLALTEINYFVMRGGGPAAWDSFVGDVLAGVYRVTYPAMDDLVRAAELELQYADLGLGLVDASVVALCERMNESSLATLDRRHFSVVRPRHCGALDLLPG